MSNEWTVVCKVDVSVSDVASLFLFDSEATAVSETERDHSIELRAGFLNEAHARAAVATINERLPTAECEALFDTTQDDWVDTQRSGLAPTLIGPWTVRAPWHAEPTSPTHDIVIDPGAAFGHGAHHSTRLAAELMLPMIEPGDTVVDLGTGTGVLAIIAAKAGATVHAIEVDPRAVKVAAANIERNNASNQIELITSNADQALIKPDDLVVANVTLDVQRLIAPAIATSNRIVVAGLLCNQVAKMSALLDQHSPKYVKTAGEWAGMAYLRAGFDRR